MKLVEMPDIEVKHPEQRLKLFVPGGWHARVAEVTIDAPTLAAYTRYLGNEREARELHQKVYESGYIKGLRLAIARRAQEYATRFPDLVAPLPRQYSTTREYVTLRGFDPERLQGTYVPFDQPGRGGNVTIDTTLTELAQEARASAHSANL